MYGTHGKPARVLVRGRTLALSCGPTRSTFRRHESRPLRPCPHPGVDPGGRADPGQPPARADARGPAAPLALAREPGAWRAAREGTAAPRTESRLLPGPGDRNARHATGR